VEINKAEPTVKKIGKRKVVKAKDNGKANKENLQKVITTTPPTTSKQSFNCVVADMVIWMH
jgi:murein L,D-transpeptidase YafK